MAESDIYTVGNTAEIMTPALLFYPDRILTNTQKAIALAGGAQRMWPHMKTHKCAQILRMQLGLGITRFKCATLAEAELAASQGASHILVAYPLTGPAVRAFADLVRRFPSVHFYALADSIEGLAALQSACEEKKVRIDWLCDVDMGMHRTGVQPEDVPSFVKKAQSFSRLRYQGLHGYDGHNHETDTAARTRRAREDMDRILAARNMLAASGIESGTVIAGGSDTFPVYAEYPGVYVSPGTVFLWDAGYARQFPDLPFVPAAAVMCRVVSLPEEGVFTLDLGYKAISVDQGTAGILLDAQDAVPLFQSEEHWTFKMRPGKEAQRPALGQVMYVLPMHICPTVALYAEAVAVTNGAASQTWRIGARNRVVFPFGHT